MKVHIEWQDQFGRWQHYTTKHHHPDAYRTAVYRAKNTNKRHRLVDDSGNLLDLVDTKLGGGMGWTHP